METSENNLKWFKRSGSLCNEEKKSKYLISLILIRAEIILIPVKILNDKAI